MEPREIFRRLKAMQTALRLAGKPYKDAALSKEVTGKPDLIRDWKRGKSTPDNVDQLRKLAEAGGESPYYFIDEKVPVSAGADDIRRDWLRWSSRAAYHGMVGYEEEDRDLLFSDVMSDVFDFIRESAEDGKDLDEATVAPILDILVRRAVARHLRSKQ